MKHTFLALLALALTGCATGDGHAVASPAPAPASVVLPAECDAVAPVAVSAAVKVVITPDHCERVSSLPVTNTKTVILSVPLGDVKAGDLIFATGEIEASDDLNTNVMFKGQLILTDGPDGTAGEEISTNAGTNVTADLHHGYVSKSGMLIATKAHAHGFVNLIAWAASSNAMPANPFLTVEGGYGKLSAVVVRP